MMYFVIAYDYNEALNWVTLNKQRLYQEHGVQPGECMYLDGPDNLIGIKNPRGIMVGKWYQRKDIRKILATLWMYKDPSNIDPINKALNYINSEDVMNI